MLYLLFLKGLLNCLDDGGNEVIAGIEDGCGYRSEGLNQFVSSYSFKGTCDQTGVVDWKHWELVANVIEVLDYWVWFVT